MSCNSKTPLLVDTTNVTTTSPPSPTKLPPTIEQVRIERIKPNTVQAIIHVNEIDGVVVDIEIGGIVDKRTNRFEAHTPMPTETTLPTGTPAPTATRVAYRERDFRPNCYNVISVTETDAYRANSSRFDAGDSLCQITATASYTDTVSAEQINTLAAKHRCEEIGHLIPNGVAGLIERESEGHIFAINVDGVGIFQLDYDWFYQYWDQANILLTDVFDLENQFQVGCWLIRSDMRASGGTYLKQWNVPVIRPTRELVSPTIELVTSTPTMTATVELVIETEIPPTETLFPVETITVTDSNQVAWWSLVDVTHDSSTYEIEIQMRVPHGTEYRFEAIYLEGAALQTANEGGDDIYVLAFEGVPCGSDYDVWVTTHQGTTQGTLVQMKVQHENAVAPGNVIVDAPC